MTKVSTSASLSVAMKASEEGEEMAVVVAGKERYPTKKVSVMDV